MGRSNVAFNVVGVLREVVVVVISGQVTTDGSYG